MGVKMVSGDDNDGGGAGTAERNAPRDIRHKGLKLASGICKGCGLKVDIDLPPTEHSITVLVGGHRVPERCGPVKVIDSY